MRKISPRLVGLLNQKVTAWIPSDEPDTFGAYTWTRIVLNKVAIVQKKRVGRASSTGESSDGSGSMLYFLEGSSFGSISRLTEASRVVLGSSRESEPTSDSYGVGVVTEFRGSNGKVHHWEVEIVR